MSFIAGLVIGLVVGWLFVPCPQFVTDGYGWVKSKISGTTPSA